MTTIEQLRRKADQHWELAGLARLDRDFADEARHIGLARKLERRIREMKVFGEAERDRVAELEKELSEIKKMYAHEGAKALHELERAEAAEARVAELEKALSESDRQAEKLEALLDPHIAWEGKPAKAYVELTEALQKAEADAARMADALRGLLKAYENAFDWTAELPPETAEAERIANEALEALTAGKPEPETVESVLLDALSKIADTDLSGCANMTTAEIFGALSRMHETASQALRRVSR